MKTLDAIIIGAGPTGLATAIKLHDLGIKNILVIERNPFLGGILKQCIHTGFGLTYFKKNYTGPEFADVLSKCFLKKAIKYYLNATAINLTSDKTLVIAVKKQGILKIHAKTIILATGCRERTRENLEIAGSRPAGVFAAGQAQNLINLKGYTIGKNVVIQGSGDIGLIMTRRLKIEGYNVIKVFEKLPHLSGLIRNKIQCLDYFNIPLELNSQISEITGTHRVTGVYVNHANDVKKYYSCDTILFSVGLIPEIELAKKAGITTIGNFALKVNNKFETNVAGIFTCGNALHIHDTVDEAAIEGELVAQNIAQYLTQPRNFSAERKTTLPYKIPLKNEIYNDFFFTNLKKKKQKICIYCPRSCILSKGKYTCKKGEECYQQKEKLCELTTTVKVFNHKLNKMAILPIRTDKAIPIEFITKLKKTLWMIENHKS